MLENRNSRAADGTMGTQGRLLLLHAPRTYTAVQAMHTTDTIPPDNTPLANGRESKRKRMHRNGTEALSWGGPAVVI